MSVECVFFNSQKHFVEPISNQICTDFAGLRLFKQSFTCAIKVKTKDQSRIVSAGKVLILGDDAFNQENYLLIYTHLYARRHDRITRAQS